MVKQLAGLVRIKVVFHKLCKRGVNYMLQNVQKDLHIKNKKRKTKAYKQVKKSLNVKVTVYHKNFKNSKAEFTQVVIKGFKFIEFERIKLFKWK